MASARLHQQFIRLWQCCQGQSQFTTLDQLAIIVGCSRRHMRSLLNAMQQQGWLSWQAQAGRGRHSWLCFHYAGIASPEQHIADLLAQDHIEPLRQQLGEAQLARLLSASTGYCDLQQQNVLRLLTPCALRNLLPGDAAHPLERHITQQIFSGLLRLEPYHGQLQPALAHHWQQCSPLHWRFFLRSDVRFHHGEYLDCQDVVQSLKRLQKQPYAAHIQHISALDRQTIALQLSQPDQWLPWLLASDCALILPKDWQSISDFSRYPSGCGAFTPIRNSAQALSLEAFNHYFGYRPLIDKVSLWLLPESCAGQLLQQCSHQPLPVNDDIAVQPSATDTSPWQLASYYLLLDGRTAVGSSVRYQNWLRQLLSPAALLRLLPATLHHNWQAAWHGWSDYCTVQQPEPGGIMQAVSSAVFPALSELPAPERIDTLRLAYCRDNPLLAIISQCIAKILAAYQITLECQLLEFADCHQGNANADLWLCEHYFTPPLEFSLFFDFCRLPLANKCILTDGQNDIRRWRTGELSAVAWCQQQRQLLPLFHHRHFPAGWCDFASAWAGSLCYK